MYNPNQDMDYINLLESKAIPNESKVQQNFVFEKVKTNISDNNIEKKD